jgi:hypothetical protein
VVPVDPEAVTEPDVAVVVVVVVEPVFELPELPVFDTVWIRAQPAV